MEKLNLKTIIQQAFPVGKYFSKKFTKTQIVLHHTVSGEGVLGDITHWIKSKFRMGTCVIVGRRGDINQLFSSRFWAYHLGVTTSTYRRMGVPYKRRDMESIGIELDSYGGLKFNKTLDRWENVYGGHVLDANVIEYKDGYRGYFAFERYTKEQIESIRQLLVYWNEQYGIPLTYNEGMFDVSAKALGGTPGVWSHTSYRFDKSDVHPQPELIEMLKSLTKN
jgi:N-acetylmuramoyl-L-alanine amidase